MKYFYSESFYLWIIFKIILLLFIAYNLFIMLSFNDLIPLEMYSMGIQAIFITLASIHLINFLNHKKTSIFVRISTGVIEMLSGIIFLYFINNQASENILIAYLIGLTVILIGIFDLLFIERNTEEA